MLRMFSIGMIAMAIGCSESNPNATDDTSSGTTGGTTTMSTTTESTTVTTTTTTMSTSTTTTTDATTETTETTDDVTTMPVDTSTGAAACDATSHRCVAEVPGGWEGPIAIRYSEPDARDPGCAGPYDEPAVVAYADLLPGAHDCDCQCGAAQDVECSNVTLTGDNSNICNTPFGSMMVGEGCTATPVALQIPGNSYWRATATITNGSCAEQPTVDVGPVSFDDRLTLCGAEVAPGECTAGEICTPLPSDQHDGRICVWQLGDLECPDATWSQRTLLHQGYEDTRGCTTCTCGDVAGECDGTVSLTPTPDCSGNVAVALIIVDGDCQLGGTAQTADGASIMGVLSPVEPQCVATNSIANGSIAASSPVTQCCLAPD